MNEFLYGKNRKNTNSVKWDFIKEDENTVNPLWIADSDYVTDFNIIKDIQARVEHGVFGYTNVSTEYKKVLKTFFKSNYNYDIEEEDIVPTMGIIFGLHLLIDACSDKSDSILITTPVYNCFYDVIKNTKRKIICNELIEDCDTYKYDFLDLEEKLKKAKIYILCNPHNPIGRAWNEDEISKIVSLCKKYNVLLLSDEIHCDIILNNNKFNSVGKYISLYQNIVILTAPSKTFNLAGLHTANLIIRTEQIRNIITSRLQEMSIVHPNILGLTACESAYKNGNQYIKNQNIYIYENYLILKEFFNKNIEKAKVYKLEATYLAWVNLKFLNIDYEDLNKKFLAKGVIINSGIKYGVNYAGYIRINLATSRENLLEGLEKIKMVIGEVNE